MATAAVQFLRSPAPSCMAGKWMHVQLLSANTSADAFTPLNEPLSYRREGSR